MRRWCCMRSIDHAFPTRSRLFAHANFAESRGSNWSPFTQTHTKQDTQPDAMPYQSRRRYIVRHVGSTKNTQTPSPPDILL